MVEVKEVLPALARGRAPPKRLAAQLGLDPQTARRYLRAAEAAGRLRFESHHRNG
jgi:DNA-binding IclR family transcriptional regulator